MGFFLLFSKVAAFGGVAQAEMGSAVLVGG
jgi:hypothetical protein